MKIMKMKFCNSFSIKTDSLATAKKANSLLLYSLAHEVNGHNRETIGSKRPVTKWKMQNDYRFDECHK